MSLRHLTLLLPLLVVSLWVTTARAHEGPPYPLFIDQTVGGYGVSVWTDPDVGEALFYVIFNGFHPVPPDLRVQIGVQPVSGRLPEAFYTAERENLPKQIQYKAQVHLDAAELWRVRVRLESAAGSAETTATVEATPPGYGRWDLLVYLVPFLAVGIVWGVAMVRRFRQRTGDKHA